MLPLGEKHPSVSPLVLNGEGNKLCLHRHVGTRSTNRFQQIIKCLIEDLKGAWDLPVSHYSKLTCFQTPFQAISWYDHHERQAAQSGKSACWHAEENHKQHHGKGIWFCFYSPSLPLAWSTLHRCMGLSGGQYLVNVNILLILLIGSSV